MVGINSILENSIFEVHYSDGRTFIFDTTRGHVFACGDALAEGLLQGAEARAKAEALFEAVREASNAGRGAMAAQGFDWASVTPAVKIGGAVRLFWHDPDDPRFNDDFFDSLPVRVIG